MTRSLLIAVTASAVTAASPFAQQADTQSPAPTFEAASVKPNKSGDGGSFIRRQPGGRMTATNMPLGVLITFAYLLQPSQLVGGPGWIANDRFDIVAKMEGDPAPVMPGSGPDPLQLAMRTLLADRFKLVVHRETRDMDVYALVMARPGGKPGPALKPSTQDCSPQAILGRRGGGPPPPDASFLCGMRGSLGRLQLGGFPLSQLANGLQGLAGRIVIDRTGLSGNWDAELTFAPEGRGGPPGALPPGVELPPIDPNAPNVFTALQEQLGLKLEATKAPVDVLVVDSVQQPTPD
jgi:bla regulator protein blaR1